MAGELLQQAPPQTALEPPATDRRRSRYLSDVEKAFALALADDGLTQVEIAQRLNCAQSSISDWLSKCRDTTKAADRYLRGQALGMAESVRKGPEHVQLKALQGLGVAAEGGDSGPKVVIQIGGNAQDVRVAVALSPRLAVPAGESLENPE